MARRKRPENETEEETINRRILEAVSNNASRSEKTSWNRKMDNMVKLIAKLTPLEDKILAIMAEKNPIFDEIKLLRIMMVKECVHPFEQLVHNGDHIVCKFCNKKIGVPNSVHEKKT